MSAEDSLTDRLPDPLTESWGELQVEVMHRLQHWSVSFAELNHHLAAWIDLPSSDASALGQVVWAAESDEPLSPVELSRRIGLTSGATTLLVDRLERAGHVTRSRESTDRRRVTLRPTPAARDRVRAFLATAGVEVAEVLRGARTPELRAAADFLRAMDEANRAAVERLRPS